MEHEIQKREQDLESRPRDNRLSYEYPVDSYTRYQPAFPQFEGRRRFIAIIVLVCFALISFFVFGWLASSPDVHGATIDALDGKKDTVMTLVAGSSGTSAAITLLPGDAATPIAEKLVDLSSDFLIVIAAIYLEKYLLTIIGFLTFKVVIPLGCALLCVVVLLRGNDQIRYAITNMVARVTLLAVALYCVVPVSVFVSNMIEQTYQSSLNHTLTQAQETAKEIEQAAKEETKDEEQHQQPTNILETLQNIPSAIEQLPEEVNALVEKGKEALNDFIEALAVMIVTSCIIPLLVLVFFLWLVKSLLGVSVEMPMGWLRPRSFKHKIHPRS